jgi:flagellar motility protein MotE (MotC chaperone)
MERKSSRKEKSKKKFPIISFVTFGVCLVGLFFIIEKFENIENFLNKIELGLGSDVAIASEQAPALKSDEVKEATNPKAIVKNEDEADYLLKLSDRKKQLDLREEDLNKQASEVSKQKAEIEEKLNQLELSREKISNLLKERISVDSQKIDTLVQVYSNMKASQAAKIFETMDEDLVIDILGKMKKKNAADILNLVKTDKAQVLSEKYAGYRVPASVGAEVKTNNLNNEKVDLKQQP